MGLVLRFSILEPIGINYRFLTHAHSHGAMLGWVYLMLYTFFVYYFIPDKKPIYIRLFWLTQISVVGMMLSFPFQGYAAISISFSTLHIFCSYCFAFLIWKHHKTQSLATKKLLKASLIFMVLSTIGVWCLGPAVTMLGQASAFYQIAIQFFLHFQFNGWFLIAVTALFFHLLKIKDSKLFRTYFWLLISSTLLTLALPIQWFAPHKILLAVNGFGVIIQAVMFYLFILIINPKRLNVINKTSKPQFYLYSFALICFALKIFFQLMSILPKFSEVIYSNRNFVIGFIHLLMLGAISGFLLAFILKGGLVTYSKTLYIGIYTFLLGFVTTEILLLIQGVKFYFGSGMLSNYYLLLFISSILLPLGIGFLIHNILKRKNYATKTPKTT
ncbi:hypothetical protein [Winogradskyella pulchriflava]|uniref:Uncharacterized protein n=1 Tax=Winogradskyella pulchriflava TaxID=1110688 RepID=A0ABV6Q9V5_9FLAO